MSPTEPIVALATPPGRSALAVIRTSGPGSIELVAGVTDRPAAVRDLAGYGARFVRIIDPGDGAPIDEAIVTVFRAPRSYTGEDSVELSIHGNPAGAARVIDALVRCGFRPAEPGEFTMRAVMAGRIDLTRAEAVREIVDAQTATAHAMALHRLAGGVAAIIDEAKHALVPVMAAVSVQLDYDEGEVGDVPLDGDVLAEVRDALRRLAATYRTGRLFQDGARVALAGRPNAGKSSLFNALLREDRAITSATPGTTRDWIEATVDLDGIPVRLFDTAGLRTSDEAIEEEGIRRSRKVMSAADIVLYLVDAGARGVPARGVPARGVPARGADAAAAGRAAIDHVEAVTDGRTATDGSRSVDASALLDDEDRAALADLGDRAILVWTKCDDPTAVDCPGAPPHVEPVPRAVPASVRTAGGVDGVIAAVREALLPGGGAASHAVVIDSLRQRDLLERAADALDHTLRGIDAGHPVDALAVDLQEAIAALGEITGEVTRDDILDAVFGGFCVGK